MNRVSTSRRSRSSTRRTRFTTALALALLGIFALVTKQVWQLQRYGRPGTWEHWPDKVTITRVMSKFEEAIDSKSTFQLPSEYPGEHVLEIKYGFVMDRGAVGEVRGGEVFDVSGGCCRENVTTVLVDDVIELKYRSSADKPRRADHGGNRPDGSIDAVYVLEHSHSTTYYHFLIEALPRLEHLWHTVSDNEGVKIFQISSFASTTFTLLGLGSNRACDDRFTVYPRVLLPPPTTDPRDAATVARLKSMSSRLVAAAGMAEVTPEDKPTWLVINRAGAKQRRIVNHEELMLGLREAFPSITFREFGGGDGVAGEGEGMKYLRPADGVAGAKGLNNTRRDQEERNEGGIEHSLRQFRSCWGVIAPHGAGLSNIVFIARSNASVVEIVGKGQAGRVYEALAGQFGHRHAYVTAPHVTWRHVHMEVNVSAVVNTVMQFMS